MIQQNDRRIMEQIINVCEHYNHYSNFKLVAAIVYKNHFYIGFNQEKSHPLQARYCKHPEAIEQHAEINALTKAVKHMTPKQLTKTTIYVCRLRRKNKKSKILILGNAKPCCGCEAAIKAFKLKRVIYTTDNQTYEEIING